MKSARIFAFLIVSALAACVCGEEEFPIPSSPPPPSSPIEDNRPEFKPTEIEAPFLEQFTDDWSTRWSASEATKVNTDSGGETFSYVGKWEVEEPTVYRGIKGDKGLVVKTPAAHHAISARLKTPLDNTNKALVVQYEVKLQKGLECGGAYLKLLTESDKGIQAVEFSDKTPYTIMFGPDRCGTTNKVHFIVRHKNPLTGEYEEKHLEGAPSAKISKISTLYTLIVNPDNTFEIKVNNETTKSGNLLNDGEFKPPFNPPKEIDDPKDSKPTDWVDNPKIPDPAAKKPDDWDEDAPVEILDEEAQKPEGWLEDEPLNVPDPEAIKPEDWDDEEDGDWVPPSISNPKCEDAPGCGEWKRPMKRNPNYKGKWYATEIDNPEYKGPWKPRKIPNPDFYEDLTPSNFEKIGAVGFELWTMQSDILFDNIYIGHSVEDAQKFAEETWEVKKKIEEESEKKEQPIPEDKDTPISLLEDPFKFLQQHINEFLDIFFENPLEAIKTKPEVAGGLATVAIIFFSLLGLLFGLIAPSKKVSASHKKTDAQTPDDKGADKGTSVKKDDGSEGDNESEPTPVTKRGKKQKRDD